MHHLETRYGPIYLVQSLPPSRTSKTVGFVSAGLFDWKKDRKFFARFEEPVSPEREYPLEEGDSPLPCSPVFDPLSLQALGLLPHCAREAELGAESVASPPMGAYMLTDRRPGAHTRQD